VKKLISIMILITIIGLTISYIYYDKQNKAEDPRTLDIGKMYKNYNRYVRENDHNLALAVLDSIEFAYKQIDHYKNSYEVGVVYVNKSAVYLTQALNLDHKNNQKEILLNTSEEWLEKALLIYKNWDNEYKKFTDQELDNRLNKDFDEIKRNKINIIKKRKKKIQLALYEINRRYSVIYTNLGIIKRHKLQFEESIECYIKAIELWDENFTAKNNLNVLRGKKPIKQNFIKRLFPPERK